MPVQADTVDQNAIATTIRRFHSAKNTKGAMDYLAKLETEDLGSALHAILASNWVGLVKKVLGPGSDLRGDFIDAYFEENQHYGGFPLHTAAQAGGEVLEIALRASMDAGLFAFNDEGRTPLMLAAENGDAASVRLLLRAGADPDQVSEMGDTALSLAASVPDAMPLVDLLLDAGADPCLVDLDEVSARPVRKALVSAQALRSAMEVRRFRTIEVNMGSGEADFVMPEQVRRGGDLFVADVIGDLAADTKNVRLEAGEKVIGQGPGAEVLAEVVGMGDVAASLRARRARQAEVAGAPAPPRAKLN